MIRAILPDGVAAAECTGDPPEVLTLPEEANAVRTAVAWRQLEHATVRHCARIALAELGLPPAAILSGRNREPLWPAGVVGSMTHCDRYRAAALARATDYRSVGIDAEPHAPLPAGVLGAVAGAEEIAQLTHLTQSRPDVSWDRLIFSAKESVFKAWYPVTQDWLSFDDATVILDPEERAFAAEIHRPGAISKLAGQWHITDELVLTAVVVC